MILRSTHVSVICESTKSAVVNVDFTGMPHYFWIFPPVPESQEYVGTLIGVIEWLKSKMGVATGSKLDSMTSVHA